MSFFNNDEKIEELEKRIKELEERLQKLEEATDTILWSLPVITKRLYLIRLVLPYIA